MLVIDVILQSYCPKTLAFTTTLKDPKQQPEEVESKKRLFK